MCHYNISLNLQDLFIFVFYRSKVMYYFHEDETNYIELFKSKLM
jgi:hypothetical protein